MTYIQPATLRALHIPNVSASLASSADLAATMGLHHNAADYARMAEDCRNLGMLGSQLYRHAAGEAEERLERIRCERREG